MKVATCPECGASVVECDNDVRLDFPAIAYDEYRAQWTLMSLGGQTVASVGDPPPSGLGHKLHEHQPEDSVMA
jgi:hypothetical protein